MNNNTKLGLSLAVATGLVAHTIRDSLKIHRQEREKRQQIKDNLNLDLAAIRRASDRFSKEYQTGMHDHLSLGEQLAALSDRIEFERITIRMED
jgi:hypothetical protein